MYFKRKFHWLKTNIDILQIKYSGCCYKKQEPKILVLKREYLKHREWHSHLLLPDLRFSPAYCSNPPFPKETLHFDFTI